jgi:hypothetical protein
MRPTFAQLHFGTSGAKIAQLRSGGAVKEPAEQGMALCEQGIEIWLFELQRLEQFTR